MVNPALHVMCGMLHACTCLRLCCNNRSFVVSRKTLVHEVQGFVVIIAGLSSPEKHPHGKCSHGESTTENSAESEVQSAATHHNDCPPPTSSHNERVSNNWILARENYKMSLAGPSSAAAGIRLFLARQRRLALDASVDLQEP